MKLLSLLILGLFIYSCNGGGQSSPAGGKSGSGLTIGASVYNESIETINSDVKTEPRYKISTEEVSELDSEVDLSKEEKEVINKYL